MKSGVFREHVLRPVGKQFRHVKYSVLDALDHLLGRKQELVPPRRMVANIGGGDFRRIGNEFLPYFIELGNLRPHDRVLEVGCGVGRMAVALMPYLQDKGRYDGMDIVSEAIDWCEQHITRRCDNFRFHRVDIYNKKYNPNGERASSNYTFPFDDQSFDFIFLTSVFTHMLPHDMERYLSELSRVLKVGKRCLITFFLLNTESKKRLEAKTSRREFRFELDRCRVRDREVPEREVAFEEDYIRGLFLSHRLAIVEPIRYGSWSGKSEHLSYQDLIVATRTA